MFWNRKNTWHVVRVQLSYEYSFACAMQAVTHIHYIRRPNPKHKTVTVDGHWTYEQLFGTKKELA